VGGAFVFAEVLEIGPPFYVLDQNGNLRQYAEYVLEVEDNQVYRASLPVAEGICVGSFIRILNTDVLLDWLSETTD